MTSGTVSSIHRSFYTYLSRRLTWCGTTSDLRLPDNDGPNEWVLLMKKWRARAWSAEPLSVDLVAASHNLLIVIEDKINGHKQQRHGGLIEARETHATCLKTLTELETRAANRSRKDAIGATCRSQADGQNKRDIKPPPADHGISSTVLAQRIAELRTKEAEAAPNGDPEDYDGGSEKEPIYFTSALTLQNESFDVQIR